MNITKKFFLINTITTNIDLSSRLLRIGPSACVRCLHNQSRNGQQSSSRQNRKQTHLFDGNTGGLLGKTNLLQTKHYPYQTMQTSFSGVKWKPSSQGNSLLKINNNNESFHRCLMVSPKAILDASPKYFQPYLRLIRFDKPIGTWLLYWPCTWSIGLAAAPGHLPDLWLLTLFGAGAFFMRGAGCIVNDMWDRDYDKMVERTKLRPLASGELNFFQGMCCLGGMLSISLMILLQLNWYSIALGVASMLLVVTYPLAKRVTFWPQAMLAVTFNYGTMLGWAAVNGGVDWSIVLPLYLGSMAWTLSYDTIYAHQDKYDDMLIGVKSTALKFGDQTKQWLSGFGTIMIGGLTYTGIACDQTWPYFCGVAFTAAHIAHQLYSVDLNNADDCAAKFRSNTGLGLVMFLGIVLGTLLKEEKNVTEKNDGQKNRLL